MFSLSFFYLKEGGIIALVGDITPMLSKMISKGQMDEPSQYNNGISVCKLNDSILRTVTDGFELKLEKRSLNPRFYPFRK